MQKVELLGVSRKIFIHSLPLAATERCYMYLLKQVRNIIKDSKNETKREQAYETLFEVMEDYNVKILSTKVYWDRPEERQAYKKFWEKYEKAKDDANKKQILLLKQDLKELKAKKREYSNNRITQTETNQNGCNKNNRNVSKNI